MAAAGFKFLVAIGIS